MIIHIIKTDDGIDAKVDSDQAQELYENLIAEALDSEDLWQDHFEHDTEAMIDAYDDYLMENLDPIVIEWFEVEIPDQDILAALAEQNEPPPTIHTEGDGEYPYGSAQ